MNNASKQSDTLWSSIFSKSENGNGLTCSIRINDDIEAGDNTSMLQKIKMNVQTSIEVEPSYKTFFLVLSVGLVVIFFSLMFLPMIALYPQKFLSLFSLGSIIVLASFIFVYGTVEYLKMLFSRERVAFTLVYLCSIGVGLYFAYFKNYYIFSLICACIQMITMIVFTLTFIPGGKSGIGFIMSMLSAPLKGVFNKMLGK
jgi:hypothetical protein